MTEKLRFRPVSRFRITEIEEYNRDLFKRKDANIRDLFELSVYDILLKSVSLNNKIKTLNTKVKEVALKLPNLLIVDIPLNKQIIKPLQIPDTELVQISISKQLLNMADIKLYIAPIMKPLPLFNTYISDGMKMSKNQLKNNVDKLDLTLGAKMLLEQNPELNTEIVTTSLQDSIEMLVSSGEQNQLAIFEELINSTDRFPRGFSESLNSPFVVLIGEDKYDWHIPIIYGLKELFCEITDKHPKITFRRPEFFEEGIEETVDSLEPYSLDQFSFEYKIEFLDLRKMYFSANEFVKLVRGRLESGFLQQFGVLIIAVKPKDLDKTKKVLDFGGLRVYTCLPDDTRYKIFCSKILGVNYSDNFFSNLNKYEKSLSYTLRNFSVFVKRGIGSSDKLQYPLKVVTFVCLLNDIKNRTKKIINSFEECYDFINEILDRNIKIEVPILDGKVIPDLIYFLEEKEIYVEIETLIGTIEPLKKIDETIAKYKDIPDATIWIVLKPISAIIHYRELKTREKIYKILYNDKEIYFKILTLSTLKNKFRWELVNIDDFIRNNNGK